MAAIGSPPPRIARFEGVCAFGLASFDDGSVRDLRESGAGSQPHPFTQCLAHTQRAFGGGCPALQGRQQPVDG